MSNIGKAVIKKVADREVVCRELTVSQVRGLMQTIGSGDLISDGLFKELRLGDLTVFTSLKAEEIEEMFPSDLAVVVQGCKEANPDFFGLLARQMKHTDAP
ncbi:hypothetical protein [Metapseudomonas otitidis]|uniref:hypothetical protein n=1 Tax=Metapseudomonas otitidis TaxID=319939 RepID=UPI0013F5D9A4|nr:hypothetical protein [Pseudomonas otitidis]